MRWAVAALTGRSHNRLRWYRSEARKLQERAEWLRAAGVHGVGIGRKERGDRRLPHLSLTVFVEEKRPAADVEHLIPARIRIPGIERSIPTDVVAIGKVHLDASAVRPVAPGCGISAINGTSGTLGCLVRRDGDPTADYLLTAGHVLLHNGAARGDAVLQPGADQGGVEPANVLASLSDWVNVKLSSAGYPNVTDAAIAKLRAPGAVVSSIAAIGRPVGRTNSLAIDQAVQISGFTSGYSVGAVKALEFSTPLTVPTVAGTGRAGFVGLVLCTRYASGGDSGAAVLDMDRRVVGIHLGGSDTTSFFSRICYACDQLGVEIQTEDIS